MLKIGVPKGPAALKVARSVDCKDFLTVWEGAVRSGKTVVAIIAFVAYVMDSPDSVFLLSGRTVKTIEKNCILGDYGILAMIPGARYGKVGEDTAIVFNVQTPEGPKRKTISVVGAADIRAYMAIRGNSYGGWFADEVNMHDREFVEEAMRRTVVSKCRRHFWTLNPDNPRHWIYTDHIDKYAQMTAEEQADLGGFSIFHFTPSDNPAMTPAMLASLKAQYPADSYLYRRYILGERCIAEGLVYPRVNASYFRDFDPQDVDVRYCAIDFGADHPTVMYFGGMFKSNRMDWRIVAEYFDQGSDKTTYDHYLGFLDMCERLGIDPNRVQIAIDPAAKTLRLEFLRHGLHVVKAKNDVLPGIDYVRSAVYNGALSFHASLKGLLQEFGTYSWDPKASERGEEKPIKINDDRMDALRYLAYTFMRPIATVEKRE